MKLSYLEGIPREWRQVLPIGRTARHDGKKYHIVGMALEDKLILYILEPFDEKEYEMQKKKGPRTQRKIQKQHDRHTLSYLDCGELVLGAKKLRIQGGSGSPLRYASEDYRTICLFVDMMRAGWKVPAWLEEEDWCNLQLVALTIPNVKRLPKYSSEMPIILKHRRSSIRHFPEKTLTLTVGKPRSFSFVDHQGDKVQCHINNVALIDMWENTAKELSNPAYIRKALKKVTPERLQELKDLRYRALTQNCPEGMCYIGIEYECSKDFSLQFCTKQYLKSLPVSQGRSAVFLLTNLKPDKETGAHGLPLKGAVMQTPVPPDTAKIPAELFSYFEKTEEWEEKL